MACKSSVEIIGAALRPTLQVVVMRVAMVKVCEWVVCCYHFVYCPHRYSLNAIYHPLFMVGKPTNTADNMTSTKRISAGLIVVNIRFVII